MFLLITVLVIALAVRKELRARKQAAEQQRKQRKQYFHDKAVSAAIERSRQQKEEQ